MYFLIENDYLLKINEIIFGIKSTILWKETIVSHKEFLKTKLKSYRDVATDFHDKEMPNLGYNHTCLPVTNIYSVFKKDENYYLQAFLREYKYQIHWKSEKVIRNINDDLEISSDSEEECSSFNKCLKRFHKHERKICTLKLLPFLEYPYVLSYLYPLGYLRD